MARRYRALCDCGFDRVYTRRHYARRALDQHDCRTVHRRSCRTCGWSIVTSTARRADYAKRSHSCARQLAQAAARAHGEALRAAIDRTPKPCLHKRANHQHGTYACYTLDACRCEPCAAAVADYDRNRLRLQAYGRWDGLVDAAAAREHVRRLMAQGMGLKRIVAVSDVSQGQLWKLLYGSPRPDGSRTPSRRIKPTTQARILAVTLDLAPGAVVDHHGTTRRVQALVALGWSMAKIGAQIGVAGTNMHPLAFGERDVTRQTADKVTALYARWSMRLPPEDTHRDKIAASRARNYAKARGWLPPLALDDDRIDDPGYDPPVHHQGDDDPALDHAAIWRRMHGERVPLTRAEAAEVVRRCLADGWTWVGIERTTGLKPDRYRSQQEAS